MNTHPPGPLPIVSLLLSLAAAATGVFLLAGISLQIDLLLDGPLGPLRLEGDAESGVFLLLAGVLGIGASVAMRREPPSPLRSPLFFSFLLGLSLVPLAGDVFTLVLAWELMSASPGILLILDQRAEVRRSGLIYLVYSQLSTFAIMAGLLIWSKGLDGTFDDLLQATPPPLATILVLGGALVKAGIMPFHFWLPEAHAAAPSPVSALMSGALVAIPCFLTVHLILPVGVPIPAATTVLLLGALSAALGALHALHERHVKRVLALTTVAHMGALFALLGVALLLAKDLGNDALPFLRSAALAYALAHGWAKGAFFFVAGEVHHATGELDLDRLGGLWRSHGSLALLAGLVAVALAGLPPFAGFPAEIGLIVGIYTGLQDLDPLLGVVSLGGLFLVAVGAGGGLAAVMKVFLGAFHGPSRQPGPPKTVHASTMPIMLLLGASLLLGVAPGILWKALPAGAPHLFGLSAPTGPLTFAPIAASVVAGAGLVWLLTRRAKRPVAAPLWACGLAPPGPRQTYSAQALVMPYRILFAELLRPASDLRLQDAPAAPFAPYRGRYEDPTPRFVEPWIHEPLQRFLAPKLERLRLLHRGPVQTYLVIALLVLVFLLFLLPVIR